KILNIFREQGLATTNHYILNTPLDFNKACIIHFSNITGMHPTGSINNFVGSFLSFPIAEHHGITSYTKLAQLTTRDHFALFIYNFNVQMRMDATNSTDSLLNTVF